MGVKVDFMFKVTKAVELVRTNQMHKLLLTAEALWSEECTGGPSHWFI